MMIENIKGGKISADEIKEILSMNWDKFQDILKITRKITDDNFGKIIRYYIPGKKFPSISITGDQCSLHCKHCNHHYLKFMIDGSTPDLLYEECLKLDKEGAVGCLISGGFNQEFHLPFENYFDTLKKIKKDTNLILNVHTGLITPQLVKKLAETHIDIVSFDLVGDDATIHDIYGLNKSARDYEATFSELMKSSIKYISPHVCIGLNFGKPSGEIEALSVIKKIKPYLIVLLGLKSTPDTPISQINVDPEYLVKIIAITRLMFPKTEISLGCMRPGGKIRSEIDMGAFLAGITRIEIPARKAPISISEAKKQGYELKKLECCCSVPKELEKNFLS